MSDELNVNELVCLEFLLDAIKEHSLNVQDPLKSYWKVAGLWYIERDDLMISLYILLHSLVFNQGFDAQLMVEIEKKMEDLFSDGLRHHIIVFLKENMEESTGAGLPSSDGSMIEIGGALVERKNIVEKEKLCLSNCICLLSVMKPMNAREVKDVLSIVKDSSARSESDRSLDFQVTYRALISLIVTLLSSDQNSSTSILSSSLFGSSFKHEFHELVMRTSDNMTVESFTGIVRLAWVLHMMLTQDDCDSNMTEILSCLKVLRCQNVLEFLREHILKIATSQMQIISGDPYSGESSSDYSNAGRKKNFKVPGHLGREECYHCNIVEQNLASKELELATRDMELYAERNLREASESSVMNLQKELLKIKTGLTILDECLYSEDVQQNDKEKSETEVTEPLKVSGDTKLQKSECTHCSLLEAKLRNKELEIDAEKRLRKASDSCLIHLQEELVKKECMIESLFVVESPSTEEKPETELSNVSQDTEIEKLKCEIELLKRSESILISDNLKLRQAVELRDMHNKELRNKHSADVAVLEEYRIWVEADKVSNSVKAVEIESEDIENAIAMGHVIGAGGYGTVYKATFMGESVAVKVSHDISVQGTREFATEVNILKKICHKNIVRLVGYCKEKQALVYEYLNNGSLEARLSHEAQKKLSWQQRLSVAFDICCALIFLHNMQQRPIVHCDLKPENILFSSDDTPKLADFGISYELSGISKSGTREHQSFGEPRGTAGYMDPVFMKTGNQRVSADVYAFGVILLQLVTGKDSIKLVEFVEAKLKDCQKLKGRSVNVQKKAMKAMGVIDHDVEGWDPETVKQLLELGVHCAHEDRLQRPSLSGFVWHKLFCWCRRETKACTNKLLA